MTLRAWLTLGLLAVCAALAQPSPPIRSGSFLVAGPGLGDPNFARTVVLILDHTRDGTMGVVINRRTRIPIARALELPAASARGDERVYSGGPVGRDSILALVLAKAPPKKARQILRGVYLINETVPLAAALQDKAQPIRVYAGYAGWSTGQLETEIEAGAWKVISGDPASVFDPAPRELWDRLVRRAPSLLAAF